MAKEIADIIAAFKMASNEGRKAALATVVCVEGSSYRMPGARMLVEDNGRMTGAISGGCLEGDALRKALQAINQQSNKLVTDTLDEDDLVFGVQLGCNGIVHILFEPINPEQQNNPITLLEKFYHDRKNAVLVTIYSLANPSGTQPGTCFFLNDENSATGGGDYLIAEFVRKEARVVLHEATSLVREYPELELTVFYELLSPPVSLVIVGAGNDAFPLVHFASVLGWPVTIVDGRPSHANKSRFPKADKIVVGKPGAVVPQLEVDERTVFVLMTHNYNYDLEVVKLLFPTKSRYIGTLGPKKRLKRMFTDLQELGVSLTEKQIGIIYGPTGLDIGAETPEEIALSIIAEIKTVLAGHPGTSLKMKPASIHSRPRQETLSTKNHLQNIR